MKSSGICIIALSASLFLFSCEKKKEEAEPEPVTTDLADGLPENNVKINCYLYSCVQAYTYPSNSYYYLNNYAIFSDPAKNLVGSFNHYTNSKNFTSGNPIGNIDVGSLTLNSNYVAQNFQGFSEVYYNQNSSNSYNFFNYNANWVSDGNKTFKPINQTITRGYPVLNGNLLGVPSSFSRFTNFTININNNISNYDSLIVTLEDGNWYARIRKVIPQNTPSITFTTQEMSILANTNSGRLSFYAYNYSNRTVNNKVILFELSNQYIFNGLYIN